MDIQYYNRHRLPREDEIAYNATYCATLEELLKTSDIISVSCPLNATTKGLLSYKEFSQMKDGVFLVNTARGAIIDEASLIAALESGKVARAGLDVFEDEPRINPYFVNSDRCIIQPHLGGLTKKATRDAEKECLENIKSLISTGRPVAPVNEISHAK
jgi:lactate dehydrogenase-like 2-hydroxyacid dehydrogenase